MKTKFSRDILFVVMEKGESFSEDLLTILSMQEMENVGIVQTALGMVKNIDLGYGIYENSKVKYEREIIEKPLELLGLSGFIIKGEKLPLHFHVYLGDNDKRVLGGHLFDCIVVTFIEMSFLLSDMKVERVKKAGLLEMDFR
ncbi:MAG: PPC domain-containing DNA-binding protein [Caldisericum sp.]|uniref:PPC domain-containing DNA-binding protein n=1 Tax=Caldisericum sp. TaxID=2499687 RepID=UPI003D107556